MDKVVKREIVLKKRASKVFTNPSDALEAFNELVKLKEEQKESEKLVDTPTSSVKPIGKEITETDGSQLRYPDSIDSFWHSVDVMDLTPTQRKHYKEIMRKEVRVK